MKSLLNTSTVCIKHSSGSILGTGIFISPKLILTCRHVLSEGQSSFLAKKDLRVIFNERHLDERRVTNIFILDEQDSYRQDVAVLEIEAPFDAGEQVLNWMVDPPKPGDSVVFTGYRAESDLRLAEVVITHIGYFDGSDKRGCYMLQDGCAKGFSGGPVIVHEKDDWLLVGMIIANYRDQPMRTWMLPISAIENVLDSFNLGLPLQNKLAEGSGIYRRLQPYIDHLNDLRIKKGTNKIYIDIRCGYLADETSNLEFSALSFLVAKIEGSPFTPVKVCVLGNYGTGKTCLAIETCYQLAQQCQSECKGVLPLYIPLRRWGKLPSQDELIAYVVDNPDLPIQTRSEFYQLAKKGTVFFVLDGMDELSKTLSSTSSPGVIQEIPSLIPENASFAVLGRTSFFVSKANIADLFALSRDEIPPILSLQLEGENFQAVQLKQLDSTQIRNFLTDRCGENADFAIKLVEETYDLPDLATRPVLLNMIVECSGDLARLASVPNELRNVTSSDLYKLYITKWLRDKKQRSHLTVKQRLIVLEDLALSMLDSGVVSSSYEILKEFIINALGVKEAEEFLYDIANCTFLDLTGERYEFSHKSFLEYFAASGIVRRLHNSWQSQPYSPFERYLSSGNSIGEITDFMRDIAFRWCAQEPNALSHLSQWFDSSNSHDRATIGHIIGHVASRLHNEEAIESLVKAFREEKEPWPKRSLAIACGRSGQLKVLNSYVEENLPYQPNREINLAYHLTYYNGLQQVILSIISHICSSKHRFLRGVDIFTLRQILAKEAPIEKKDEYIIDKLSQKLNNEDTDDEIISCIQNIGLKQFVNLLSA